MSDFELLQGLAVDEDDFTPDAEYVQQMEEEDRLIKERRNRIPPAKWGDPMTEPGNYFCSTCWYSGEKTGAHPYSAPPCDPIQTILP